MRAPADDPQQAMRQQSLDSGPRFASATKPSAHRPSGRWVLPVVAGSLVGAVIAIPFGSWILFLFINMARGSIGLPALPYTYRIDSSFLSATPWNGMVGQGALIAGILIGRRVLAKRGLKGHEFLWAFGTLFVTLYATGGWFPANLLAGKDDFGWGYYFIGVCGLLTQVLLTTSVAYGLARGCEAIVNKNAA